MSPLDFSIDRNSDVPLATQLAWKLRTLVATGALRPGDRLPGVREIAEAAGVNVNTVRSVFGRLEEEGLLSSQHGRGTFIAGDAAVQEPLARVAAAAAAEARRAGLDPREVAAALFVDTGLSDADTGLSAPARQGATSRTGPAIERGADERAQRRRLRGDIARLEGELAYLEGLSSIKSPPRDRPRAGQILTAAELAAVRDDLAARVADLRTERAETRRSVAEERRIAEAQAASEQPASEQGAGNRAATPRGPRVWRHGGVWTGPLKPGGDGVVYES